jgi:transcriptional regulator GlxA family with amidase domain
MSTYLGRLVYDTARAMMDPEQDDPLLEDRLCSLTQACFDQSWQWTARAGAAFIDPNLPSRDYRVRNALRLMQDRLVEELELDEVAREVGLSRPHFYKLFRQQMGVTPNVFLNTLRMERAIDRLAATHEAVSDIGLDLGFSSQASFSRFFIANGVVAPSAYRRSVLTATAH